MNQDWEVTPLKIDPGEPTPEPVVAAPGRWWKCPKCASVHANVPDGDVVCGDCRWRGNVRVFEPLSVEIQEAKAALPDNAVCIHHPSKLATAVCLGTGDFICDLCRVDLKGQAYSVQYLEAGGKEKMEETYRTKLPRPDRAATMYLVLTIFPYTFFLAFIWLPLGVFSLAKTIRRRRTDKLFRRVCTSSTVVVLTLLYVLFFIGLALGAIAIALFGPKKNRALAA